MQDNSYPEQLEKNEDGTFYLGVIDGVTVELCADDGIPSNITLVCDNNQKLGEENTLTAKVGIDSAYNQTLFIAQQMQKALVEKKVTVRSNAIKEISGEVGQGTAHANISLSDNPPQDVQKVVCATKEIIADLQRTIPESTIKDAIVAPKGEGRHALMDTILQHEGEKIDETLARQIARDFYDHKRNAGNIDL